MLALKANCGNTGFESEGIFVVGGWIWVYLFGAAEYMGAHTILIAILAQR